MTKKSLAEFLAAQTPEAIAEVERIAKANLALGRARRNEATPMDKTQSMILIALMAAGRR